MYSPKEEEIIARCLSISVMNYKVGKLLTANKVIDANLLRGKVKRELTFLKREIEKLPTENGGVGVEKVGFFKRIFSGPTKGAEK